MAGRILISGFEGQLGLTMVVRFVEPTKGGTTCEEVESD